MVCTIPFSDKITIWWMKKDCKEHQYRIYLNDEKAGETSQTFYRLENLQPNTEYTVTVACFSKQGEETLVKKVKCTTLPKKTWVDITRLSYFTGKGVITSELQRALDELKADEVLYFPKGVYLTGALNIHSNSELYLDEGAVIKGSENVDDYLPKIKSRFEGIEMECYRSLMNIGTLNHKDGYTTKNVIIRGRGAIDGGGKTLAWNVVEKEKILLKDFMEANPELVASCETSYTIPARRRGRLINISNAEHVILSGVEMRNGPSWNVHFVYSNDIITEGCTIYSSDVWNGDGWDPDSSTNCAIFDCLFNTGDDCVAIKSGKNPEGNIINRPTKNIYVFSCSSVSGHGIAIGSEMSGGIENVYVWDCDFTKACFGVHLKSSPKRGGYVKNIFIEDSIFCKIQIGPVDYNDDGESANALPVFRNIYFRNLTLTTQSIMREKKERCKAIEIRGFDENEQIKNMHLENIKICCKAEELSDNFKVELVDKLQVSNVGIE